MRDKHEKTPLSIGAAVRFTHEGKTIHGHLLERQGRRRFAKVIDDGERTWRVPEAALTVTGEARRATMVTRHDEARAAWRVGDAVTFTGSGGPMRGEIAKLNPKRAKVRRGKTFWNVPYGQLRREEADAARNGAERLNAVAATARRLMDGHGLVDWTLAFVESGRRLGDCNYRDRVIRIGRAHRPGGVRRTDPGHRAARDRARDRRSQGGPRAAVEGHGAADRRDAQGQSPRERGGLRRESRPAGRTTVTAWAAIVGWRSGSASEDAAEPPPAQEPRTSFKPRAGGPRAGAGPSRATAVRRTP